MKTYNRGVRLANKSKTELQSELADAQRELARLDAYQMPDSRVAHIPPWLVQSRRNVCSKIGRIKAALKIQDDAAYVAMIESR